MKHIFLDAFQKESERSVYTELVFFNIIYAMKTLVIQSSKFDFKIEKQNEVKKTKTTKETIL